MKMVRGCTGVLGCEKQHKVRGSMKARQEYVQPSAKKGKLCISYNEMMSI